MLLYMHEKNILTKIRSDYKGHRNALQDFYDNEYLPVKNSLLNLTFSEDNKDNFSIATNIFNSYYQTLLNFSKNYNISSQSKLESTFLEEISVYLFKDLTQIQNREFGIFNRKIYAGLKIDRNQHIAIITKDVDFCIGKKVNISIDNQPNTDLILPIVAIEVKTYLDATMFGEVKSSSKLIRSASPNSKAYLLIGYKCLADEHIIAARQDSTLTEIFTLRSNNTSPIDSDTIYEFWKEISDAVNMITNDQQIQTPGRLLNP